MSNESTSGSKRGDPEGARARAELAPQLANLDDQAICRPSADPHAAAVTALLVADYLAQPELAGKLDAVGMSGSAVADLRRLSRALIDVVADLDGDYLPDAKGIPGDLLTRGEGVRAALATALEKALRGDSVMELWLEAVRLGDGVVDLVYDLRTLAALSAQHSGTPAVESAAAVTAHAALAAADAIEFALRADDSAEITLARNTLARLWTLFLPAYDRAAAAGRALTRGEGRAREFPPLALVASHRRARRRPLSLVPAVGRPRIPSPPALPVLDAVAAVAAIEVVDATVTELDLVSVPPARTPTKPPSVPPTSAERESWSDTRQRKRQPIEIEVGLATDSNFYTGFTENLSSAGIFVATYASKPVGTHVEIAMSLPSGDKLTVKGIVRWLRNATPDGWPGIGVQFDGLSSDDEAAIRKFLSLRDPMFYDD